MGRPSGSQWQPLGWDTDPVPGDPEVISQEARLLASVADQINGQIAALRKISSDQTNVGQTADKLRSSAEGLATTLQVVSDRYQRVSSALTGWVGELEQAQSMSIRALDQAEAPYAQLNQVVALPTGSTVTLGSLPSNPLSQPGSLPGSSTTLTPAQQQQIASYQAAMQRAQGEVDAAKALLNQAISLRDEQGSAYASKINSAVNDALRDSRWDKFKSWVTDNSGWLKTLAKVLGDIVAVLAVLCLLIPGVDLLLIAALALTAMLLVIHTMLAATGNGSWIDVAIDVVGLLTLGWGLEAADSVEGAEGTARSLAEAEQTSMFKSALQSGPFADALDLFRSQVDADGSLTRIGQLGIKNTYKAILEEVPKLPEEEAALTGWAKAAAQFKAGLSTWKSWDNVVSTFTNGADPGIANAAGTIDTLRGSFSTVETVTAGTVRGANVAYLFGNATVLGDAVAGQIGGDSWDSFKDGISDYPLSTWQAETLVPNLALVTSLW
jgi:hypothetical protein